MVSWKHIQRTFENCLITVKCKQWADGSHPVFLLGLAELKKRIECTEGWLLIISGDPLVAHGVGAYLPNKVNISKLHVTWDQSKAVTEGSTISDGNVYLYAGKFFLGKCAKSCPEKECMHENLDVLKLLSDLILNNLVELEPILVIPYKIKNIPRIYKPKCLTRKNIACRIRHSCHQYQEACSQNPPPPPPSPHKMMNEKEKLQFTTTTEVEHDKEVTFVFRRIGPQTMLELECPASHSGYQLEVCLMETFVCQKNVIDSWGRGQITRVLEQDVIQVPPSFVACQHRGEQCNVNERVVVPLKSYQPPNYEDNHKLRSLLDMYKVEYVEHWSTARVLSDKGDGDKREEKEEERKMRRRKWFQRKRCEGFTTTAVTAVSTLLPKYHYCYPNIQATPSLAAQSKTPGIMPKAYKGTVCAVPVRMVLYKMMLLP